MNRLAIQHFPLYPNNSHDNVGKGSSQMSCSLAITEPTPGEDTARNLDPIPHEPQCDFHVNFTLVAKSIHIRDTLPYFSLALEINHLQGVHLVRECSPGSHWRTVLDCTIHYGTLSPCVTTIAPWPQFHAAYINDFFFTLCWALVPILMKTTWQSVAFGKLLNFPRGFFLLKKCNWVEEVF